MPDRAYRPPHCRTAAAFLPAILAACGGTPPDPDNREIPWAYGPINSVSTVEHARGTGNQGGTALAKGWQCRLEHGTHLTVQPYQLAASHPLFGKVTLSVGLFDKDGGQLATLRSPVLTATNATFAFDLDADVAKRLWDLIFWYRGE